MSCADYEQLIKTLCIEIKQAGITDFVFVVGYRDEAIRSHFGHGERWGVSIDYMTQRKQLGTADALRTVSSMTSGSFLLVNGDAIVRGEDMRPIIGRDVKEIQPPAGLKPAGALHL